MKRLFKKLGKEVSPAKDKKPKSIQLTPSISMHDLENKKRRAIEFLKSTSTLKFFMQVNVYDQENVQKGRLILLNIAEDLKEYSKIAVHPGGGAKKTTSEEASRKGVSGKDAKASEVQQAAEEQVFVKMNESLHEMDGDDEPFGGFDEGGAEKQYIYMELTSTANFRDIDIDAMLEQTTMDDFMRGLKKKGYDG